jgi:hypothetical protein
MGIKLKGISGGKHVFPAFCLGKADKGYRGVNKSNTADKLSLNSALD